MDIHLQKWGNSLAVRLPAKFLKHLNLKGGSVMELVLKDDHLLLLPKTYQLTTLLETVTPENCHHEMLDSDSQGQEVW